jgi:hypothetical protein
MGLTSRTITTVINDSEFASPGAIAKILAKALRKYSGCKAQSLKYF